MQIAGVLAILCGLLFSAKAIAVYRRIVFSLPTSRKVVALTFDDGPDPRYTPQVLKILRREHVPATFFLVGSKVVADAGRTDYSGYLIGDHTYTHGNMGKMTTAQQIADFRHGGDVLSPRFRQGSGYFRPPRKSAHFATIDWAEKHGTYVLWNIAYDKEIRTHRFFGGRGSFVMAPADRVHVFVSHVRPGDIVLMHDGNFDAAYLVHDLSKIIDELRGEGYRFVTLDDYPLK